MSICPECLTRIRAFEACCSYCDAPVQKQSIDTLLRATNPLVWKAVFVGMVFVLSIALALLGLDALFPTQGLTSHAVFSGENEVDMIAAAFNP